MTDTLVVPDPPGALRWALEGRKSRRRLYPPTIVYTAYSLMVLTLALRRPTRWIALVSFTGGVIAWTLLEYFVHRYVLHGRFPSGPSFYRRFTHRYFDHLHWEHHARPWDGDHISGTLNDTLRFSAVFVALAALSPLHTGPVFVAGLLQAYVVEEWIHHSVHFYNFKNRYFRYIKRHHLFHHSPKGTEMGFGLSSGFWDVVWGTRIKEPDWSALHAGKGRPPRHAGVPAGWWQRARRALHRDQAA